MKGVLRAIRETGSALLEIILPSRARTSRTKYRNPEDLALTPTPHDVARIHVTTLLDYRSKAAEDTIRSLKYDGSKHAARLCAALLADYLREEIASIHAYSPRQVLLIPVPLHKSRERERGFNQIERVLRELPDEFRNGDISRHETRGLVRIRRTKQQTHLSRAERLENVKDAFRAEENIARGNYAIVIDDVVTTGATLSECARALEAAGAKTSALALSRA